jgi:hypothetical protein
MISGYLFYRLNGLKFDFPSNHFCLESVQHEDVLQIKKMKVQNKNTAHLITNFNYYIVFEN